VGLNLISMSTALTRIPSAILDWTDIHIQIEVFEDRYQIYDFSAAPGAIHHIAIETIGQLPSQLLPRLDVEPQQVVPVETEATDWCF
jgi:hypothetical protein